MMSRLFFALSAILAVGYSFGAIPEEEDVLVLGNDNFEAAIEEHSLLLVEFYAPWCGHCKKLAPEYAKAAGILKEDGIRIAKVDATEHRELGEQFEVRGFPTLKLFKNGKPLPYSGGRTSKDIVDFMKKKSGPTVVDIQDVAAAEKLIAGNEKVVIGYATSKDSAEVKKFNAIADEDEKFIFGLTTDAAVAKKYEIPANNLALFTGDDVAFLEWGALENEEISKWMFGHSIPLMIEYNQDLSGSIFGGSISVHCISFLDSDSDSFDAEMTALKGVGAEYRTEAVFIYMPKKESRIMSVFDLEESDMPAVVIADMRAGSMKKYIFEGKVNTADVKTWVQSFFDGKISPKLKSAEPSEDDLKGDVKVITGKSFADIVINNKNDVLVEFYAPWCGHCKALEPKYNELGAAFAGVDTVTIAKMDATENEIDYPGVDVKGFPTLLFFPGNDKTPIAYDGQRETEAMISYIQKHASNPIDKDAINSDVEDDHDEL